MPPNLDPHAEAMGLLAMSAGLGSSVMAGQQSPEQAAAILRYHLDRILPPGWRVICAGAGGAGLMCWDAWESGRAAAGSACPTV